MRITPEVQNVWRWLVLFAAFIVVIIGHYRDSLVLQSVAVACGVGMLLYMTGRSSRSFLETNVQGLTFRFGYGPTTHLAWYNIEYIEYVTIRQIHNGLERYSGDKMLGIRLKDDHPIVETRSARDNRLLSKCDILLPDIGLKQSQELFHSVQWHLSERNK